MSVNGTVRKHLTEKEVEELLAEASRLATEHASP
jgi:hypothetical protein